MIGATFPALYGLLGYPLGHTLSPPMHQAALAALGLPGTYEALPVPADRLAGAMAGVRAWRLPGLSVTIPHKVAVMAYLDEVTPLAQRIGAVNTIYWDGDKLCGDNTDYAGFRACLPPGTVAGQAVTVLGAGGAARAAVLALADEGAARVHLVARRQAAAEALRDQLLPGEQAGAIVPFEDLPELQRILAESRLVVNATPLGMHGKTAPLPGDALAALPADAHVMDMIYAPAETPLMAAARARGLAVSNGAEMLLHQAAFAFERWTGAQAPLAAMREALHAGLAEVDETRRTP
ncbi:MAG: shikimate 5-dehydrogenase [Cyanobacteria bacterium RYN_339]|nr:shikimate 5-dehydrogenase [Cyanobacteria bacterium RYN_339]